MTSAVPSERVGGHAFALLLAFGICCFLVQHTVLCAMHSQHGVAWHRNARGYITSVLFGCWLTTGCATLQPLCNKLIVLEIICKVVVHTCRVSSCVSNHM